MATSTAETHCFSCDKETSTFLCRGCSKDFCLRCLPKHMQVLGQELDRIQNDHEQFRQRLNEEKDNPKKHLLVQKIDRWKKDSINKIRQTAEECRTKLIGHKNKGLVELENKLKNIAQEIKRIREENEFNEIHLNQFKQKLDKLREEFDKPTNVSVEEQASPLINQMAVIVSANRGNPNSASSMSNSQYSGKKLGCKGRACAKCGYCRDWYWRPDNSEGGKAYTKRADATCHGGSFGFSSRGGDGDGDDDDLCECEDNRS